MLELLGTRRAQWDELRAQLAAQLTADLCALRPTPCCSIDQDAFSGRFLRRMWQAILQYGPLTLDILSGEVAGTFQEIALCN